MILHFILLLFLSKSSSSELSIFGYEANDSSIICIAEIVRKYFTNEITFVDINSNDRRILEALHSSNVSVITRNTKSKLEVHNEGYVIQARNITGFVNDFKYLTKQRPWNPRAKFLIIIESMDKNNITAVFDELLRVHVINVLLINGNDQGDIYTYNPFENYNCGRRYDEVVPCGPCKNSAVRNLYPDKLVTGLRNCTFRSTLPYLPTLDTQSIPVKSPAIAETSLLETIASLEQFNLDVKSIVTEGIGDVDDDFNVTGYLKLIQDNETDMIMGFKTLSQSRASAFDYIHWHFPFADALVYVVAKASYVPPWKYIYIEFSALVWFLIAIVFIICSALAKFIIRDRDTGHVVLNMWDIFLGHGDAQSRKQFRYVLIQWLWFSYLIGCFYQSSLCSFTVNPQKEHQVSSEEELSSYNFKPCVSNLTRGFIRLPVTRFEDSKDCDSMWTDVAKVSNSEGMYSITYLSLLRSRHKIANKLYLFKKPLYKMSYSIYLYKGFPMFEKLEYHTLRLRENGLAEKFLNDIYSELEALQRKNMSRETHNDEYETLIFVVPWHVYGLGVIMATAAFVLEIYYKNNNCKSRALTA